MQSKRKKAWIISILIIILLLPLWMWLAWLITPKRQMVMAIIDKTEITRKGQEHVSLTWILNHERYTKTPTQSYGVADDYFGFFPQQEEKFRIKGLERFNETQLEQLSNDCSIAYFTDTYGVYRNEWYSQKANTERSGILYGGLSEQDLSFLEKMKAKKKMILAEFNTIGSPTQKENREAFEKLFGLTWTGWIGRHFESLDTSVNKEIPRWMIDNYLRQHGNQWPFKKQGVAFVSDKDEIEILGEDTHLTDPLPTIESTATAQSYYNLPPSMKYGFWFDIMRIDTTVNKALASFRIHANDAGRALLANHQLDNSFPAVITSTGKDYGFYYFSADFCDNPVQLTTSYFKGISTFKSFFYNSETDDRRKFFWTYYRPLLTTILRDHARTLDRQ